MDLVGLLPGFGGLIWTLIAFVIALSVIVAVHEYGHYIVGRWCGIKADVFSIGFGPVLWARNDKRGTKWQIAALPFGGYVKFAGDANAASGKDEAAMAALADDPESLRHTMHGAPLWARSLTVAAGPVFNFAMSIMIFFAVAFSTGIPRSPLTVGVMQPLPTGGQELQAGDEIIALNGLVLPTGEQARYSDLLDALPATPTLDYEVMRDGKTLRVTGPYILPPLVGQVVPQSAAIEAGLRSGDVITAVDGTDIFAFSELKDAVESSDGASLALRVWRDGETQPAHRHCRWHGVRGRDRFTRRGRGIVRWGRQYLADHYRVDLRSQADGHWQHQYLQPVRSRRHCPDLGRDGQPGRAVLCVFYRGPQHCHWHVEPVSDPGAGWRASGVLRL